MKSDYRQAHIGLIGTGLDTYWGQFQGLHERLESYLEVMTDRLRGDGRHMHNFGMIDSAEGALSAAHACRRENIDLLLIYVTTYTLSAVVLPIIRRAGVPVLVLNVQPGPSIDCGYTNGLASRTAMTGEWLAYCSACAVPELTNIMRRLDIPFRQVIGVLEGDDRFWVELEQWLRAAEVAHVLAHARLGLMGHYYSGMLDIATDLLQISGRFGLHLEMIEVDELSALRSLVSDADATAQVEDFRRFFDVDPTCLQEDLFDAARTSLALERLVRAKDLDLLAYYYKGAGTVNGSTLSTIILGASMLTGAHVPVAGEYEVKNVVAMKILDVLGVGGSFTEYYAVDFLEDIVLMGHDGPGHVGIAQDKIRVRPLKEFHGKVGSGLSVEMSVRRGPVTLLSVVEDGERGFLLLTAQGEAVPGDILTIGNTNSRYRFSLGARGFMEAWNAHGPAHHCAIGVGHVADQIEKIAWLLGMKSVQVC